MSTEAIVLTEGSDLSSLDIYLDLNGTALNASGVTFQLFDAAETAVTPSIDAVNVSTGKYTASGTIPTGGTLGTWRVQWKVTPVGASTSTVSENFCVNAVNVSFGFEAPNSILGGIFDAIRIDIGDPDGIIFNDDFLRQVVVKGVRRLNQKLGLAPTMRGPTGVEGQFGGRRIRVTPLTLDITTGILSPPGSEYEDLLILQSEYIIAVGETASLKRLASSASSGPYAIVLGSVQNEGVEVTNADGVKIVIGGSRVQTRASLHRFHVETLRMELDAAVKRFLARLTGNFGKLVY